MISGYVSGVIVKPDCVRVVLHDGERKATVDLCLLGKSQAIRPGDHVWTQSRWAMWSSKDLGVEDQRIPQHYTKFDGSHPCCKLVAEVHRDH